MSKHDGPAPRDATEATDALTHYRRKVPCSAPGFRELQRVDGSGLAGVCTEVVNCSGGLGVCRDVWVPVGGSGVLQEGAEDEYSKEEEGRGEC